MEVWRIQKSLEASLGIGQKIWFESGVLDSRMGVNSAGYWVRKPQWYGGQIKEVIEWQKSWVRFGITALHGSNFHLWVPFEQAALGFILYMRHFLQRSWLADNIPLLPTITVPNLRTRRLETSREQRGRRALEVAMVSDGGMQAEE